MPFTGTNSISRAFAGLRRQMAGNHLSLVPSKFPATFFSSSSPVGPRTQFKEPSQIKIHPFIINTEKAVKLPSTQPHRPILEVPPTQEIFPEAPVNDLSTRALTYSTLIFPAGSTVNLAKIASTVTNFSTPKTYFKQLILDGNHEIKEMYRAKPELLSLFRQVFPEVVASRGVSLEQSREWARWDAEGNDVKVEWQTQADTATMPSEHIHVNVS